MATKDIKLTRIEKENLIKKEELLKNYASQKSTIKKLEHMLPYEKFQKEIAGQIVEFYEGKNRPILFLVENDFAKALEDIAIVEKTAKTEGRSIFIVLAEKK